MGWYRITDNATGEAQYVATLDGIDLETHEALELSEDRGPEGIEAVGADGSIFVPVASRQAAMWEQVKAIRQARETGVAITPLGGVQIDEASKAKILGTLDLCKLQEEAGQAFSLRFTMADNSRVLLDGTTVRQLAGAVGLYVSRLYDHSFDVRDRIDAATTHAELDAIDVEVGWP